MGNSLERPITEKTTSVGNDGGLPWGVSSMQGWRITMEDAHICQPVESLPPHHYLFCVFDGHGGGFASTFCRDHFMSVLSKQSSFQQYRTLISPSSQAHSSVKKKFKKKKGNKRNTCAAKRQDQDKERLSYLLQRALEDTFVDLDLLLLQDLMGKGICQEPSVEVNATNDDKSDGNEWGAFAETETMDSTTIDSLSSQNHQGDDIPGTTGIAVLVTPEFIICANVGDSRATLATTTNDLTASQVIALSRDHKPNLSDEEERIHQANGVVTFGGRVDGELAVSRALGDFGFKDYHSHPTFSLSLDVDPEDKRSVAQRLKVSPFPETSIRPRCNQDGILVVACDGIWDVMTNTHCVESVQMLITEGESNMGLIAEEILDMSLKKGSRDNMTIIVVKFPGQCIGTGGGVMKRRRQRESKR
jgi:serine/threonine protein phosphatase PrpC